MATALSRSNLSPLRAPTDCFRRAQDYTLGSSRPFKTRNELDRVVYAERQLPSSSAPSSTFPSLQSTCISVAADNYGAPGVWSQLDRFAHLPHVPALLQAILDRAGGALLPFAIWAQFAAVFGDELPSRRRTYRGLCVADEAEIESLKLENEQSLHEWAQAAPRAREMLATPCFFLAVLDLANDVSFGDQDVSKLRKLAPLLAVLKLDYTRVTDDGLAWIARSAAGKDGAYQQLQVLSLKGLRKVSDEGVLRLGKLPLRMLGELAELSVELGADLRYRPSRDDLHQARED